MKAALRVVRKVLPLACLGGACALMVSRVLAFNQANLALRSARERAAELHVLGERAMTLQALVASANRASEAHPAQLVVQSAIGAGAALATEVGRLLGDAAADQPTYQVDPTTQRDDRVSATVAFTADEVGVLSFLERLYEARVALRLDELVITANGVPPTLEVAATVSAAYSTEAR